MYKKRKKRSGGQEYSQSRALKSYVDFLGNLKLSAEALIYFWSIRSISTDNCPFLFTALILRNESNVSSRAINRPRTSFRKSKCSLSAGPSLAACITLILLKKDVEACCGFPAKRLSGQGWLPKQMTSRYRMKFGCRAVFSRFADYLKKRYPAGNSAESTNISPLPPHSLLTGLRY